MVAEAAIPSSGGQDRLEKAGERKRENRKLAVRGGKARIQIGT